MKLGVVITTPEVRGAPPVALLSGPFEAKLDRAAQLGYHGVELMPQRPSKLDPARIANQVRARGLGIAAVASGAIPFLDGLTLLHPDAARARVAEGRLHELIELAAAAGAPVVTLGGFRGRLADAPWTDADGARRYLVETLRKAVKRAGGQGVRIALEPLNRYESDIVTNAREGLDLLTEVAEPALGLLLDTYHMNIEEPDFAATFSLVARSNKLFHVHVGDSNRLAPGRGHTDFAIIVDSLRRSGYRGYLSAELLGGADPDAAGAATSEYMRRLL
jgi:sugar phosphate isomerase/epimerase